MTTMTSFSHASGPATSDPRRIATEYKLNELTGEGGPITTDSKTATCKLYGAVINDETHYEPSRLRFHGEIIDRYMSDSADVGKDGLAAIMTAGPPGAGKSTK